MIPKSEPKTATVYRKQADFRHLAPSALWNIIDKHPDSMGGAATYFPLVEDLSEEAIRAVPWRSLPSSLHQGGAVVLFEDGHAIKHRWVVASTRRPVLYQQFNSNEYRERDDRDYRWLITRSTEAK